MKKSTNLLSFIHSALFVAVSAYFVKSVYGVTITIIIMKSSIGIGPFFFMLFHYYVFKETIFPLIFILLGFFFLLKARNLEVKKKRSVATIVSSILISLNISYSILALLGGVQLFTTIFFSVFFAKGYVIYAAFAKVTSILLLISLILLVLQRYRNQVKFIISVFTIPYVCMIIISTAGYLNSADNLLFYNPFSNPVQNIAKEISSLVFTFCILIILFDYGKTKTNLLKCFSGMIIVIGIAKWIIWCKFNTWQQLSRDIYEYGIEYALISIALSLFSLYFLFVKYDKKWMRILKYVFFSFVITTTALLIWQLIFVIQIAMTWGYYNLMMPLSIIPLFLSFVLLIVLTFLHSDLQRKMKLITVSLALLYPTFLIVEFILQFSNPVEIIPPLQTLSIIFLFITGVSWSFLSSHVKTKSTKTIN